MRLQFDHWPLRLMGVLFGLGCLIVGVIGILVTPDDIATEAVSEIDFAIIALVTGLIALVGSLISSDIIGFWYCNPKRLAARRAAEERASKLSTSL